MIIEQIKVGFMEVFCYLLGCKKTGLGLVIDPAGDEDRIVDTARRAGIRIESVVNTHGHPDHTCGNARIVALTGAKIYMHALDNQFFSTPEGQSLGAQMGFAPSPPADVEVTDGDAIGFGQKALEVIHTPGHTPGGICLHVDNHLFTGDTLFVGAVGRTDFPGGSMETLLESIRTRILTLPDDTIIWPGHDYGGRPSSTVAYERHNNPYISEFIPI
ncbi:MAG: MBL fold metallo-hydrolase [Deltaproteobacteria bacterium]|nr:MBL fold metallo-hydrolase [Deltaproteobacteria bacterium]